MEEPQSKGGHAIDGNWNVGGSLCCLPRIDYPVRRLSSVKISSVKTPQCELSTLTFSLFCRCCRYCAPFFITTDINVQKAVKPLAKYLWLGAFFWAPVAVSEGILLARRELGFLAGVYLATTALLPPVLLKIKFQQGNVAMVWAAFGIFQVFRTVFFTGRIWLAPVIQKLFGRSEISKQAKLARE